MSEPGSNGKAAVRGEEKKELDFTFTYGRHYPTMQSGFRDALADKKYDVALGLLDNIPLGTNTREQYERIMTLTEGYRIIAHQVCKHLGEVLSVTGRRSLSPLEIDEETIRRDSSQF